MSAREFAESKGVKSTLTDEEAVILDKYDYRMSEGKGDNIGRGLIENKGNGTGKNKIVPPTKEIKEKFDKEGLTQGVIDKIVLLPKSQKPKPESYLSQKYIKEHLQSFKDSGAVKIMPKEPSGTIGGKGGTFVMSGNQLDVIIKSCKGDISNIEDALGFDWGYGLVKKRAVRKHPK
jgi:hypothetical protein